MILPRSFLILIPLLSGGWCGVRAAEATGWEQASLFLFREAGEAFRKGKGMEPRERKLGEGLSLLNAQPRTRANLERALDLFAQVAAERADDDYGLIARLSGARTREIHLVPQEKERAREIYRELVAVKPGHPVCELAAARLVILELYEEMPPEELRERVRALAVLGEELRSREGKANFHYTLGMALVEMEGDPALALPHLRAAFELGMQNWQSDARLLVALGATAEALGERGLAQTAYERFVKTYRRDRRTYAIKARLEALRTEGGAPHG